MEVDGQTDRYGEGNGTFRTFAKAPRNCQERHHLVRTSYIISQSYRLLVITFAL
jgi:hypothetical protein